MPIIRVQHSFQGISGTPKDQYVNTFHILGTTGGSELAEIAEAVKGFYTDVQTGGYSVADHLAGQQDGTNAGRIKMYNLDDAKPRDPIYDEFYTPSLLFGGSSVPLPSEVACCLSYSAAPVSGVPVARLRGRIYIGPLTTFAIDTTVTNNGIARPSIVFRNTLSLAGQNFGNVIGGVGGITRAWQVWSPTRNAGANVASVWVDDAWDTQRRRGDKPTSRVTQTISY